MPMHLTTPTWTPHEKYIAMARSLLMDANARSTAVGAAKPGQSRPGAAAITVVVDAAELRASGGRSPLAQQRGGLAGWPALLAELPAESLTDSASKTSGLNCASSASYVPKQLSRHWPGLVSLVMALRGNAATGLPTSQVDAPSGTQISNTGQSPRGKLPTRTRDTTSPPVPLATKAQAYSFHEPSLSAPVPESSTGHNSGSCNYVIVPLSPLDPTLTAVAIFPGVVTGIDVGIDGTGTSSGVASEASRPVEQNIGAAGDTSDDGRINAVEQLQTEFASFADELARLPAVFTALRQLRATAHERP